MGLAISLSLSYVTISNFTSLEERRALLHSVTDVDIDDDDDNDDEGGQKRSNHIMFASSTNTNCDRYSAETLLNDEAKVASSSLLNRPSMTRVAMIRGIGTLVTPLSVAFIGTVKWYSLLRLVIHINHKRIHTNSYMCM